MADTSEIWRRLVGACRKQGSGAANGAPAIGRPIKVFVEKFVFLGSSGGLNVASRAQDLQSYFDERVITPSQFGGGTRLCWAI
jgi:hypothetical protein